VDLEQETRPVGGAAFEMDCCDRTALEDAAEELGRFVCGFLAARADRRDLDLRKRSQGWNVGVAPPAGCAYLLMMPTRIFSVAIMIFLLGGLSILTWARSWRQRAGEIRPPLASPSRFRRIGRSNQRANRIGRTRLRLRGVKT
jgi:hypothetical protein